MTSIASKISQPAVLACAVGVVLASAVAAEARPVRGPERVVTAAPLVADYGAIAGWRLFMRLR